MTQPQKNTALTFAIIAGLFSLPLTWMTIRGARMQGGLGDMFNSMLGEMTVNVTGLNGHLTFLVKTPIWFIVSVAIAASVLQLMQSSKTFAIPHVVEWLTAIVAVAWVFFPIVMVLFSDKATLGIGLLLGFVSAVIPAICLATSSSQKQALEPDFDNAGV